MALRIGLVAATGSVTLQRATGKIANYASDNLKYDINGTTINFYQLAPYVWLGSEVVTSLENAAGAAIGIESVVRTYLDAFVGASKAL
jgi:hypothetical protein